MFAPDLLNATVDRLVELAAGGRALEFAVGTGRVTVPFHQRGVPVAGIEIAPAMLAQLRTKVDEAALCASRGYQPSAEICSRAVTVSSAIFCRIMSSDTEAPFALRSPDTLRNTSSSPASAKSEATTSLA